MVKKTKLRVRKANLILFVLLGIGLLFVLVDINNSSWDNLDKQERVRYALETFDEYEVVDVWGGENPLLPNGVEMIASDSDSRSLQVFVGLSQLSLIYNYTEEAQWGYTVYIIEDTQTCRYDTMSTNYESYRKTKNGERVFVDTEGTATVWMNSRWTEVPDSSLDGLMFERVVELADIDYNRKYPHDFNQYRYSYMDEYRASYPEVKYDLLSSIVWYQVMKDPTCKNSRADF